MSSQNNKHLANVPTHASPTKLINPNAAGQFLIDIASTSDKNKNLKGDKEKRIIDLDGLDSSARKGELNADRLKVIGENVARRRAENKRLLEVVPDFKSIVKLITAGVQNPNTLERGKLRYVFAPDTETPEILRASIIDHLNNYYEQRYRCSESLELELEEMLAKSGSVFKVILPPDRIQKAIRNNTNFSMESLRDPRYGNKSGYINGEYIPPPLGIFGEDNSNFSMENLFSNKGEVSPTSPELTDYGLKIKAIDNVTYLRNAELENQWSEKEVDRLYKKFFGDDNEDDDYSMEGMVRNIYREGKENDFKLPVRKIQVRNLNRNKPMDLDSVDNIVIDEIQEKEQEYLDLLSPAVSVWSPESMIVCHRKGNPSHRLGYIAIMGKGGAPLTIEDDASILRVKSHRAMNSKEDGNVIKKIRENIFAEKENKSNKNQLESTHQMVLDHFKYKVNHFLSQALMKGVLGRTAEIVPTDEALLSILYGAIDEQEIRLVFIPERLCVHFALEHNEYGMGKTMFDDGRLIFRMKAALLYSQIYAAISSSRPIKDVVITIDPDSPDPKGEALMRLEALLRSEQMAMPWSDITESSLERVTLLSGMNIRYEGSDNIPMAKTEVKESYRQNVQLDRETIDLIDDIAYKSIGYTKEVANWFSDAELATTIISNNLQVAQRIQYIQNTIIDLQKEFMLKVLPIDGEFVGRIIADLQEGKNEGKKVLKTYGKDTKECYKNLKAALNNILRDVDIELPKPDTSIINAKRKELEDFMSMADVIIEGYINEDMFDGTDEMRNHVRAKKSMIRSALIRLYNESHDAIPELNAMFDSRGDSPFTEEHNNYVEKLARSILNSVKRIKMSDDETKFELEDLEKKIQDEREKELAKRGEEGAESDEQTDDTEQTDEGETDTLEDEVEETEPAEDEENTEEETTSDETETTEGDEDNPFGV